MIDIPNYDHYPVGIRVHLLGRWLSDKMLDDLDNFEIYQAIGDKCDSVFSAFVDRNLQGLEYEKLGQLEDAIPLYEANVADAFEGAAPYERLRVIYRKQHRYADAIRVCKAYDEMARQLIAEGEGPERFSGEFTVWAQKMASGK